MGFVAVYMRPSASQEALSEALVKFKDALRETDIVGGDVNAAYWRWARDCKNPLDFRARLIGEAFPEDLVFVTDGSPTTIQHRGLTERTVDVLGAVAGLLAKPRTIHDITYSTATHRPIAADLCISTPANLSMTENKTDFTLRPPVAWTACTPEQFERFNATFERTYKRVLRKKTSLDRQHAAIAIDEEWDIITDKGTEVYSYLQHRGIEHLLILGVHSNMCVLHRTFAIKQMVRWGVDVALIRDLTDAMYNPAMPPYVSYAQGTGLVIEFIEKFWCPSVESGDILGA